MVMLLIFTLVVHINFLYFLQRQALLTTQAEELRWADRGVQVLMIIGPEVVLLVRMLEAKCDVPLKQEWLVLARIITRCYY
jgi:hypothetical protein